MQILDSNLPDWHQFVIAGLVLIHFLDKYGLLKRKDSSQNGEAGLQSCRFWHDDIREIVKEVMTERNPGLENMLRKVVREELQK